MDLYKKLAPQEKSFHDALVGVVEKHGKFSDESGVYVGYESAGENEDNAKGVNCGNCSFYAGGTNCMIIKQKVEKGGKCRLAAIPDGYVTYNKDEKEDDDGMKNKAIVLAISMGADKY
jgi:hypothetical protein